MGKFAGKSGGRRRSRKAPPPLAPTRSGRRGTPPPSQIKVTRADGSVEFVDAWHFHREKKKRRRG